MYLGLNQKPNSKCVKTMGFIKGIPVVGNPKPRGTPKEAIDFLKAQNWAASKDRMVELTYGPEKTHIPEFKPKWVKLDSKMLTFDGVIREDIDDWCNEKERVRFVKVYYFLENDTLKVIEPGIPNCGLIQGNVLKQGHYLTPDGRRNYNWKDLNIGKDLYIYGRKIHLYDCDQWTRQYLTDAGLELKDPEPKPVDPHAEIKINMSARKETKIQKTDEDLSHKFYLYDGKVLRFFGIWKDLREPVAVRRIVLKYYLSDDSVEVVENYPPSSGWGPLLPANAELTDNFAGSGGSFKTILRRQPVLFDREKEIGKLPVYLQPRDIDDVQWMTPEHFRTDQDVTILGKTFYLAKCDDFTSHFYRERYGIELPQVEVMEKPKPLIPKVVPPHGIGRFEETLQDCFKPIDRPPKRIHNPTVPKPAEVAKTVLRFAAILDSPRETDRVRKFIVSFFLEDDTVKVHEVDVPNSGFGSGTFLMRGRLRKDLGPTADKTSALARGARPVYYEVQDFYIGAKIRANGGVFILKDADALVFRFMENHPEIYGDINVEEQMKLADLMKGKKDLSPSERVDLEQELRRSFVLNYGCCPYPITAALDLGSNLSPRRIMEEKLYSANLPVSQVALNKLIDAFTFDGLTDVKEVWCFLLKALGHDGNQHYGQSNIPMAR